MATIQELMNQRGSGLSEDVSNVNFLLKKLKRDMMLAQQEDRQRKKNIKSVGKTGLEGIKTRREFLLAKRFKPDLTFKNFLLDPKTAGQYMLEGSKKIASGKSSPINFREMIGLSNLAKDSGVVNIKEGFGKQESPSSYNPDSPFKFGARDSYDSFGLKTPNVNMEKMKSDAMLESLRSSTRRSVPMAQEGMLPDVKVEPITPPPMGDVSNQGLQNMLGAGRKPLPSGISGVVEGNLPKGIAKISGNTASKETIKSAMDAAKERLSATEGVSTLGSAGEALGAAGSALNLGSGLSDISKGQGDLSAFSKTAAGAVGAANLAGYAVNPLIGAGLSLLSLISKRRR